MEEVAGRKERNGRKGKDSKGKPGKKIMGNEETVKGRNKG